MTITYQQLVEDSVRRLSDLMRQRRKLDAEIARLQKLLRRTVRFGAPNKPANVEVLAHCSFGATNAVQCVLTTYRIWLTPALVRDLLPSIGFDTGRYKEPLTWIHGSLRRLVLCGKVIRREAVTGKSEYLWVEELEVPKARQ